MSLLQVTATASLVRGNGCRMHLLLRGATGARQASCHYDFALRPAIGVGPLRERRVREHVARDVVVVVVVVVIVIAAAGINLSSDALQSSPCYMTTSPSPSPSGSPSSVGGGGTRARCNTASGLNKLTIFPSRR